MPLVLVQGGTGMKRCDWCLWLGDEKIYDVRKLRENFDTPVLVGYYLGGGLERWLSDANETAILEKIREIDRCRDIGSQLEFIFGVRPEPKETPAPEYKAIEQAQEYHEITESVRLALAAVSGDFSAASSYNSSFIPSSFRSIFEGEFEKGSFRSGSFRVGSFIWGSFRKLMLKKAGGSFRTGSFRLVRLSYGISSFKNNSFRFGSGVSGSFRPTSGGSFRFYMGNAEITQEEYKRTKINLSSCPLNEYGYGIHRI